LKLKPKRRKRSSLEISGELENEKVEKKRFSLL